MKFQPSYRRRFFALATVGIAMVLGACSKKPEETSPVSSSGVSKSSESAAEKAWENTKDAAGNAAAAVRNTTADAWTSLKNATYDERVAFRTGVSRLAQDVDAKVAVLERKGGTLSADAKDAWSDGVSELREARNHLGDKLEDLGDATADNWDKVKAEVASAWERVEQSYRNLERKVSS